MLAHAASGVKGNPTLTFYDLDGLTDENLREIAFAGQGRVIFSDEG